MVLIGLQVPGVLRHRGVAHPPPGAVPVGHGLEEHKKINICLFNNASYGCINNLQVGHGNDTLCTELRWRGEDGNGGSGPARWPRSR